MDRPGVSCFHGEDDLLGLTAFAFVVEVQPPVDALVRALLALGWPGAAQAGGPPLELVGILFGKGDRVWHGGRFADHLVFRRIAEGVQETVLHEGDGQVGDVYSDPPPLEALGYGDGSPAAAEGVEDEITLFAARVDDALQK